MNKHRIGILLMVISAVVSQYLHPYSLNVNAAEAGIEETLQSESETLIGKEHRPEVETSMETETAIGTEIAAEAEPSTEAGEEDEENGPAGSDFTDASAVSSIAGQSAGTNEVNAKFGTAVQTSAQNAGSIVERCSGLSDHDKLMAYKDEICRLVEYDADALTDYTSYGKPPYGNPWQIQYSLKSDFSRFKTVTVSGASAVSKTISGLTKSRTYYVRIRSYRMNGKTNSYSAFSKARKVTISR